MNEVQSLAMCRCNRLILPRLDDEPFNGQYESYQQILDMAYEYKRDGNLYEACKLLERPSDCAKSLYQLVRTEYIFARYYEALDADRSETDHQGREDPLGMAADHYAKGAAFARRIPDWALVAQLKKLESDRCYGSSPYHKRYRRAYGAAHDALVAWRQLNDRHLTSDLQCEYLLADAVGVRAQAVAKYPAAVEGLERAAIVLLMLRDREDKDVAWYQNADFFLDWDWAALDRALGKYGSALMRALSARDKALGSSTVRNYGRVNTLIAEIALDCVDHGVSWHDYEEPRQLVIAEGAFPEAISAAERSGDVAGKVLALLVNARWLRRTRWRDERHAILEQAQKLASSVVDTDPILLGRVEIAWGDEYAFLNLKRHSDSSVKKARSYYQQAKERLTDVEALGYAQIAGKRIMLLHKQATMPKKQRPPRKRPNDPPPDDVLPLN